MKDFYWAEKRLDKDIASSLIDAISDSSYAHPIDTTGKVSFYLVFAYFYFDLFTCFYNCIANSFNQIINNESNIMQLPMRSNIIQLPMRSNITQLPMRSKVIQLPMRSNIMQLPMNPI